MDFFFFSEIIYWNKHVLKYMRYQSVLCIVYKTMFHPSIFYLSCFLKKKVHQSNEKRVYLSCF